MLISELHHKKILILGFGEEGIDNLLFIRKHISFQKLGVADVVPLKDVSEEKRKYLEGEVDLHFGDDYLAAVEGYDVVVKSPGVPLSLVKGDCRITSQSDIFLSNCKGRVVGVTGTKGKSTTCTLLQNTLQCAGVKSNLIGNIGKPALSYLGSEDGFFVYELSSFQLETVTSSPFVAVLLNVFRDHLDKHLSFEEYLSAKEKITLFQTKEDFFIYNENDKHAKQIAEKTVATKLPYSSDDSSAPILKVLEILKIEKKFFRQAEENFKGLPHRMEYVGSFHGVKFYNDSAATVPEAVVKALTTLKDVQTVIIGGVDKGSNYTELLEVLKRGSVRSVIIFQGSNDGLREAVEKTGKSVLIASSMEEAVGHCFSNTEQGKACLLSPGFSSFNMFKNLKERGELFKRFAASYKK